MSSDLLSADVEARRDALDIERSFIVQAPAGSGKTGLLIQRYLKLLSVVDNPEEVLAITFTRKAAMEMRLRVIAALRNARDEKQSESAHEQLTLTIAAGVLQQSGKCGWQIISHPGRLRIETVDAFSAGLSRSLPLVSGLGGTAAILTDAPMKDIYRQAAVRTLDWLPAGNDAASAVEQVLQHLDNNTFLYIGNIERMLASRAQWLGLVGSGASDAGPGEAAREQLEAAIARVVEVRLESVAAKMPDDACRTLLELLDYAAKKLVESAGAGHRLCALENVRGVPGAHANDLAAWQAIANALLTTQGTWRKRLNKNDGFPPGDSGQKKDCLELIETLRDEDDLRKGLDRVRVLPEPVYKHEQWLVLLALLRLLPLAVAELRTIFAERGVTDHAEVALAAQRALGSAENPGDIALALDYRIRHVLIDELQDTSIGQYELLKTLTAGWVPGDGRSIFCVGDPMQSIYRFRDAEVAEFLVARESGIGTVALESLVLRRNFRSGENLVHCFNTVFGQIMPLADNIAAGEIAYSESVPVTEKSAQGEFAIHPLFDASSEQEAAYTARLIRDLLQATVDEDVAVLVRSRTHLPALLHGLRELRVAYQAIEIDRLTDLPEITDLISLTRSLCHESDRLAWLALLRAPWVGLTWQDLHALVVNDTGSSVVELMSDADRLAQLSDDGRRQVADLLYVMEPFRRRMAAGSLRARVEGAWFALRGPALIRDQDALDNVYRFFDVLDKVDVAGSLEDVPELERLLDEEKVSSAGRDDCRLQIMTMHKSKGLQFDHVILYGLGRTARGIDSDVLKWLHVPLGTDQNALLVSPVGPRATLEHDPLYRFIASIEAEIQSAELDRLLYVACTRAVRSLQLVGHVSLSRDGTEFRPPDSRSLLWRLWRALESEYEAAFGSVASGAHNSQTDNDREVLVTPPLRRIRGDWSMPAVPPAPRQSDSAHGDTAQVDRVVDYYWVGSGARYAGTIVHRWLQRLSQGVAAMESSSAPERRATSEKWALELGVGKDRLADICDRVESALSGIHTDARGRWILYGEGHAELPVTGICQGAIRSVIIDRVRIADDEHWIIDYKTSSHEGGDLDGFLDQEADRYRTQLQQYAELYGSLMNVPVRTALYFPLLQAFREVEISV